MDSYINHNQYLSIENLRDVQDEILNVRKEATKVPNYFFKKYNQKFKQDSEKYIALENKYYEKEYEKLNHA